MNEQNLKPFTSENAKENGRKGGLASGIARNKDKDFKALVEHLAHQQLTDEKAIEELKARGLDTDYRTFIFYKIFKEATDNDNYKAQAKLFDAFLIADLNPFNIANL